MSNGQTTTASAPRKPRKEPTPMTKAKAAAAINKILEQLPVAERAKVLAFVGGE